MTEGRLAPEEVRTRTFTRVVRGYRPRQVRRLLERAATDLARLRDGAAGADDQPPLTSQEIEEVRFQPAIGGYEMDEVDQFLDQLMVELERVAHDSLNTSALPAAPRHAAFPTTTPGPQRGDLPRPGVGPAAAESFGRLEDRHSGQWMGPLTRPPVPGPQSAPHPPSPVRDPEVGVPQPSSPASGPEMDRPHPPPPAPGRQEGAPHPPLPEGGAPAREGSQTPGSGRAAVHSPGGSAPGADAGAEAGAGPEAGGREASTAGGEDGAGVRPAGGEAGADVGAATAAEAGVGEGPAAVAGIGVGEAPGAGVGPEPPHQPSDAGPAGPPPPRRGPAGSDEGFFPPPTMPPSAARPSPPPAPTTQRPAAGTDEGFFPPPSVPPSAAPQAPPPRPAAPLAAQAPSTGRPLTPAEVETRNFDRGAPGYLPNHVDLFLARAARALAGRDGETMTRWDVLRQRFPLGPRGYATSEVDAFLVRLAAQFPDPDPETQQEILRKLQGG
jgi:DivIVA domain-containing protein